MSWSAFAPHWKNQKTFAAFKENTRGRLRSRVLYEPQEITQRVIPFGMALCFRD